MFEKEVEKVIEKYIANSWYASTYRTESIQEDISKRVYHALPVSEEIVDNLVKYPNGELLPFNTPTSETNKAPIIELFEVIGNIYQNKELLDD